MKSWGAITIALAWAAVAAAGTLPIKSGRLVSNLDANGYKVTGLATPSADGDSATKGYVDTVGGTFLGRQASVVTLNPALNGYWFYGIEPGAAADAKWKKLVIDSGSGILQLFAFFPGGPFADPAYRLYVPDASISEQYLAAAAALKNAGGDPLVGATTKTLTQRGSWVEYATGAQGLKADAAEARLVARSNAWDGASQPGHTQPYASITNPPSTYTPSAHNQAWSTIDDKPTTYAPIIGSGAGDAVAGSDARLTNARDPNAHDQAASTITGYMTGSQISNTTVSAGSYTNVGVVTVDADGRVLSMTAGSPRRIVTIEANTAAGTQTVYAAWGECLRIRHLATNTVVLKLDWPAIVTNLFRSFRCEVANPNLKTVTYADTSYWNSNGTWTTAPMTLGKFSMLGVANNGSTYEVLRVGGTNSAERGQ